MPFALFLRLPKGSNPTAPILLLTSSVGLGVCNIPNAFFGLAHVCKAQVMPNNAGQGAYPPQAQQGVVVMAVPTAGPQIGAMATPTAGPQGVVVATPFSEFAGHANSKELGIAQ